MQSIKIASNNGDCTPSLLELHVYIGREFEIGMIAAFRGSKIWTYAVLSLTGTLPTALSTRDQYTTTPQMKKKSPSFVPQDGQYT
jgi:hypothetical protein